MTDLVWVDLETTGLDEKVGTILELGLTVTDEDLVTKGSASWVMYLDDEHLTRCDPFILDMHGRNGLLAASRKADTTATIEESAVTLRLWLVRHAGEAGQIPMAGSNVAILEELREIRAEANLREGSMTGS
jgi:oligoribonuclease (3'-5' exoribonuclease)